MKYDNTLRENQSLENKKRIIETSKKLILEKGYDQVSVALITKEAQVSKGAFYIHFKNKEELIPYLIDDVFGEIKENASKLDMETAINYYLINSVKHIEEAGLKMAQSWFSDSVKGSIYGKSKIAYDIKVIKEILIKKYDEDVALNKAEQIVSIYYGILISWCFTDGNINPINLIKEAIETEIKAIVEK